MRYTANQQVSGFRVKEAARIEELNADTFWMIHEKTGAELFFVDNGAENMVFSIAFRTMPEDNTGVFHILEHSVLNGSAKYPVKEPFVELLKSSMNTFLNAMTFPDMTMYPVASRNPRDLMNLTEVYLDAVFAPIVMKDRKRFCQEGWHIDRDDEGNPVYKGVVFNEMKGSMSDTDNLIEQQLMRQLFPDTCYGFNSGGDPEAIPDLTYEQFQAQYRKWYHPSNARIYLDGKVPMEEMLPLIDRYLSAYEKRNDIPEFVLQKPQASEETIRYELGAEEDEANRGYLSMARLTGTWEDRAENMARGILCDVLTGSNEAPLKRAALERELCQDLSISVDDTGYQSWITIQADNVRDGGEQAVMDLIRETGERIQREGLDRDAVEASMNRAVYHLREEEEPQGIGRCIRCIGGGWLFGGHPATALRNAGLIRELKGMLQAGRFEELAADMLLNREGVAVLHTLPSHTLGEEKRAREAERLKKITDAWTEAERKENDRLISDIEAWQDAPDSEEDLRTLPVLKKEDADIAIPWVETDESREDGVRVLRHTLPCNGVVHIRASFALTDLSPEELTKAAFLASLLGKMPTRRHSALKLQQEIKRYTGNLGFTVSVRSRRGQDQTCVPSLIGFASALEENAEKAQELLAEILTETLLDETDKIAEIVQQSELAVRMRMAGAGHVIGMKQVMSLFSAEGAAKNALDGEPAIRWIHAFAADTEKMMPDFLKTAAYILSDSICTRRMLVSITAGKTVSAVPLISDIPEGTDAPEEAAYPAEGQMRTGYRIPAQIGYAVRGWRLSRCGKQFSGTAFLASSILSLGYLWNRVRVQGGAYGAGLQVDQNGNVFSYSYRDPTPGKTLQADGEASAYLKQFAANGENLDAYIISSLNELNPLLSPRDQGALADNRYLCGYTREEAEKVRQEILHATHDDLVACGEWLDRFAAEGAVCVVAHQDALSACDGLEIRDL